jgi:hypothetical protein
MAESQLGLMSLAQLRAIGMSNGSIYDGVARGILQRMLPRVFRIAGTPGSWDQDVMALHLWAGDESAASIRAAARRFGVSGFGNAPVEISTTNARHCGALRLPSGRPIVVHRVDSHLLPEIVATDPIPVTSPRRTVLDLAGIKHRFAETTLDSLLRRGLTEIGQLWLLLEQEWMRGRRGVAILRDMLIPRTEGQAPTDSEMEIRLRHLIDDAGLPPPVHQHPYVIPSGPIRMDLAYPERLLDIEADSYSWHFNREAFERDRRRDNELRALGWTVLRFTWAMIRYDSANTIVLIRHHLVD